MKTEKTLTVVFLIGVFFKMMHWEGAGLILTISLLILSIIYFPVSFYFFSDRTIKRQNVVLSIISGIFLSLIPIGVLYKLQYWGGGQGGQMFLLYGAISSSILLLIVILLKSKSVEDLKEYYKNMLLRTSILTFLAILFYLVPSSTLIKIQYWNEPELARLKTLHYLNPDNSEYKEEHDQYLLNHETK